MWHRTRLRIVSYLHWWSLHPSSCLGLSAHSVCDSWICNLLTKVWTQKPRRKKKYQTKKMWHKIHKMQRLQKKDDSFKVWRGGRQPVTWSQGVLTFALQALPEEALEEPFTELAHGGPCVGVDDKGVWHLHLGHQNLVKLNWPANVRLRIWSLLATNEWLWWRLLLGLGKR